MQKYHVTMEGHMLYINRQVRQKVFVPVGREKTKKRQTWVPYYGYFPSVITVLRNKIIDNFVQLCDI